MTREQKIKTLKDIFTGKRKAGDVFVPDLSKLPIYLHTTGCDRVQVMGTNEVISLAEYEKLTSGASMITFRKKIYRSS